MCVGFRYGQQVLQKGPAEGQLSPSFHVPVDSGPFQANVPEGPEVLSPNAKASSDEGHSDKGTLYVLESFCGTAGLSAAIRKRSSVWTMWSKVQMRRSLGLTSGFASIKTFFGEKLQTPSGWPLQVERPPGLGKSL